MTDDDKKIEPRVPGDANQGVSAPEPAEGADEASPPTKGSPKG